MDFGKLDLRGSAEIETWLHLRVGDEFLYADDDKQKRPCRIKVASVANNEVEAALKAGRRAAVAVAKAEDQLASANRQQRAEFEKRLDSLERRMEDALKAFLAVAIVDWENIEIDGKAVSFSEERLADLSEPKAPFARMATAIMEDMGNLLNPFSMPDKT